MAEAPPTHEELRDFYDRAPCGFLSTTMDGVILNVNETLRGWLGHPREQMVGASVADFLPAADSLFYETRFILAARLRGELNEVSLNLRCADGGTLPVLVNARVQTSADGGPLIRAAVFGVTQRADYERTLLAARREAEANEERVRVLQQASAVFAASKTIASLAAGLADVAGGAFAATHCAVLMLDTQNELALVAGEHPLHATLRGERPETEAARRGEVVIVADLDEADAMYPGMGDAMRAARLAALSATPLLDDASVLGVLVCSFRRGRDFDESTVELKRALTRQAAQVVLRLRLEDERLRDQARSEHLRQTTHDLSVRLRDVETPEAMAHLVAAGVGDALDVDAVRIVVLATGDVRRVDALWPPERPTQGPPPADEDLTALAVELWSGQAVLGMNARTEHAPKGDDTAASASARAFIRAMMSPESPSDSSSLVVPLGERDTVIGLLGVHTNEPGRMWTSIERSLLQNLAANLTHNLLQASLLIAQAQTVERMAQLDQEKSDLITTVNHELRTPLASITGYVDLIAELIEDERFGEVAAMLDVVQRNADRMESLIETMMAATRHGQSQTEARLNPVDVEELLRSVLTVLRPLAAGKDVTIVVDTGGPLVVRADQDGLEQVLVNLIENAVKFSTQGRLVKVHARREGSGAASRALITVSDSGMGIPETDLSRVGTRFFRGSNAITAAVPGSGLGLSIARGIIEAAGGELTLASRLGVGTEVCVTLPAGMR